MDYGQKRAVSLTRLLRFLRGIFATKSDLDGVIPTLEDTGVAAGSYGPSGNVTGSNGATVQVPYLTVDAKGRITNIVNRTYQAVNTTYAFEDNDPTLAWGVRSKVGTVGGTDLHVTLPANPNVDTKVTATATTTSSYYPVICKGSTATSTITSGVRFGSNVSLNPGTGHVKALGYDGIGYGTCATAAATVAKVVALDEYSLAVGGFVTVYFQYAVPASATMDINSQGAKSIYFDGAPITAGIILAGDRATFVYDGSVYHLISVSRACKEATTSAAGLMSATDKAKLEEAYGWGNHANAGYLTSHQSLTSYLTKSAVTGASTLASTPTYVLVLDSSNNIRRMTVANFCKYVIGSGTFIIS